MPSLSGQRSYVRAEEGEPGNEARNIEAIHTRNGGNIEAIHTRNGGNIEEIHTRNGVIILTPCLLQGFMALYLPTHKERLIV